MRITKYIIKSFLSFLSVTILFGGGGCSVYSTFPQEESDSWISWNPKDPPVPQIVAATITEASVDCGLSNATFSLTSGMNKEVYDKVIHRLNTRGSNIKPMVSNVVGVHTTMIRVRGFRAEVDVVVPDKNKNPVFKTYYLKRKTVGGFVVVDRKVWDLPVEWPKIHSAN